MPLQDITNDFARTSRPTRTRNTTAWLEGSIKDSLPQPPLHLGYPASHTQNKNASHFLLSDLRSRSPHMATPKQSWTKFMLRRRRGPTASANDDEAEATKTHHPRFPSISPTAVPAPGRPIRERTPRNQNRARARTLHEEETKEEETPRRQEQQEGEGGEA